MIHEPRVHATSAGTCEAQEQHARVIDRLFREHNDSLLRFLTGRLGSHQEAKEIAQEAYVRLLKLDVPEAVSYQRAYLFKTASNLAIDRLRTRSYRERTASLEFFEQLPQVTTPEREVSGAQEVQVLSEALMTLPPKCRYAFVLAKCDGLDAASIAQDMGISERMVRAYIVRALMHCRASLKAATGEDRGTG